MIFITNFNNSRDLMEIKQQYDDYKGTNINFLLDDFAIGHTRWSVPEKATPGDIVVFMCAKEARHNLGMAVSSVPDSYGTDFINFVENQKNLYRKYSGQLLGYGIVSSMPENDGKWWMADIDGLLQFHNTVHIDDFNNFIFVSRTSSITYLNDEQWDRLKWIISQKNHDIFPEAVPPEKSILEDEFNKAVKEASEKPIDELRIIAEKKKSKASSSMLRAKVYHRDPSIAAYVKKRADGHCQLCGSSAPFIDKNGDPYLECHHIEWLSNGGIDSIDNCVALCPNCHRKMHILNSDADIQLLKKRISN